MPQSLILKRALARATELGLSRSDRVELSEMVLYQSVSSWKNLSDSQLRRVCDALDGYGYVRQLLLDSEG